MNNHDSIRILLNIDLVDRSYRYSDVDGESFEYSLSNNGVVINEESVILYTGNIVNSGFIKEQFSPNKGAQSIGNVNIVLFNEDNLHLNNKPIALESGYASLFFINENMYDRDLGSFKGKIDNVTYDETNISFQIRSEEISVFKNVPESIMEEQTFQDKVIFKNPGIQLTDEMIMRYGNVGGYLPGDAITSKYIKRLYSSALGGRQKNYWKGSRCDIINADGDLGDPSSEVFSIGEFAVTIESENDWVRFPAVLDRYYLYTFIDKGLKTGAAPVSSSYEMSDVLNNTMRNAASGLGVEVKDPNFFNSIPPSTYWTIVSGWTVAGTYGYAEKAVAGTVDEINQLLSSVITGLAYKVLVRTIRSSASGDITVQIGDTGGKAIDGQNITETVVQATPGVNEKTLRFITDTNWTGTISNISVTPLEGNMIVQLLKNPVPENSDSIGRPFPIVYGAVEKLWAIHAISTKSTRQNSFSVGDDLYIIAGHEIVDSDPTEIKVYYGLDENAQGQTYKPGTIDYIPNPFPRSISEIEHWNESGYSLRSGDSDKDTSPLHKLVRVTTRSGQVLTGVRLRGDEYTGWVVKDDGTDNDDGDLPAVNGQPQFPIRYGLGGSKVYVSFRGMEDTSGEITGHPKSLIEHPIDIIKHFILNYTNLVDAEENFGFDGVSINEESFAIAKSRLSNWKFAVGITDIANGKEILDRITQQCKSIWALKNGKFEIYTFDLENQNSTIYIDERQHFKTSPKWSRPSSSSVYNDFIARYGFDPVTNEYKKVITRNKHNDQRCRNSFSAYGFVRSHDEILLPDIYDSYTANKLIDHYVAMHAMQRRSLIVDLRLDDESSQLRPGVQVMLTYSNFDGTYSEDIFLVLSSVVSYNKINIKFLEVSNIW